MNSGNHASVFNHYDINSIYIYDTITFSSEVEYLPNKYYLKDVNGGYILSTDISHDPGKTYY